MAQSHTSQKPLEGGYDYQFVEDPPESLKCLICLLVARDPQQHGGCGKLFCKTCITKYTGNNCPHCRQNIRSSQSQLYRKTPRGYRLHQASTNTTIFNDFKSDQEVKALMVFCTTDCGWKGPLASAEKHETNDCLKRQYTCPHCNEAGVYDELTTNHLSVCPKVKIKCSKCSIEMLRCHKRTHHLVCENEPEYCKYYNIGCREKPLRKDLSKHEENAQFHLDLAMNKIMKLVSKNTLVFKVTEFEQKKFNSSVVHSSHFSTSEKGYKMCLSIHTNGVDEYTGTHVSVYAHLMKGDHDDILTWPFTGSVTFELLNQLEDKNHHMRTVVFPADQGVSQRVLQGITLGWGIPMFISHAAFDYNASTNTQYLKDDTLVFRVSAEAPNHKPWLECTDII